MATDRATYSELPKLGPIEAPVPTNVDDAVALYSELPKLGPIAAGRRRVKLCHLSLFRAPKARPH